LFYFRIDENANKVKQRLFFLLLVTLIFSYCENAQITTKEIKGTVIDNNGETLFGANIVVIHVPTGSISVTTTQGNGKYTVPNSRVGGPYSITFSYAGYKEQVVNNIYLILGKTTEVNGTLTDRRETLDEIIITSSRNKVFNKDRTRAHTSNSAVQLKILPTIHF
jgi:hypothetical protein